jgi:succinate dehydrogenase hydrophobic anchor subunit
MNILYNNLDVVSIIVTGICALIALFGNTYNKNEICFKRLTGLGYAMLIFVIVGVGVNVVANQHTKMIAKQVKEENQQMIINNLKAEISTNLERINGLENIIIEYIDKKGVFVTTRFQNEALKDALKLSNLDLDIKKVIKTTAGFINEVNNVMSSTFTLNKTDKAININTIKEMMKNIKTNLLWINKRICS